MHFQPRLTYHVYNRGNDRQTVFFTHDNYLYFLRKVKQEWLPLCDVLAWCLMPNHFHFLLVPNEKGCLLTEPSSKVQQLQKTIGKTLSSYTRAINKSRARTGNLFQQKTKSKCLFQDEIPNTENNYLFHCFHYIHYNPVKAAMVSEPSAWMYSSAPDYHGKRNGTLCNKDLLYLLGGFNEQHFDLIKTLNPELLKHLF